MRQKFSWNDNKIEELKKLWNTVSLYKLAAHFHTTEETITKKAEELNLPTYKSNRWTKEEEDLLRECAPKYVTKTIAKKLGRSILSVQKKAIKLNIELHGEKDPWKKWMIAYLKENINQKPIGEIQNELGLSYHRILTKCNELGIEYVKESWTEEEIATLKKYAKTCHYTELTKVLPRRTIGAITAKAYKLGIETISDYAKIEDDKATFIKNNWLKMPATEIARQLKISTGVVYRYKRILGLPNKGQQVKWTPEIISKIRKDAKKKTRNELAKKYKTTPSKISTLAKKHNIELLDAKCLWNESLDKELKKLISENLTTSEISSRMHIKASSIRTRCKTLGLKLNSSKVGSSKRWTKDEVKLLISYSQEKTIEEIATILSRNEKQVYDKARKLGITLTSSKNHQWTEEETETLIKLHHKYELHIIAKVMERSEETIKNKARELKLPLKLKERKAWTPKEEEKLIAYAENYTMKEIAILLDRSVSSINGKLKYIGVTAKKSSKFWTPEEIKTLTELASSYEPIEISNLMNKSYESVYYKLQELGIKAKNNTNRVWNEDESNLLLELLTTYSSFEVAAILNRSEEAVVVRAIRLGYDINMTHRRWTSVDDDSLSDLWGSDSVEKIAKKLNRTVSSIINRVYVLKLGSQISNNYEGISIQDLSNLFMVNRNTILTSWVALGLKLSFRKRSDSSIYSYVGITDLFTFLKNNQNIWDSRILEKNILGKEPDWLIEKRQQDKKLSTNNIIGLDNLNKQQLLLAKRYILDIKEGQEPTREENSPSVKLTKKIEENPKSDII